MQKQLFTKTRWLVTIILLITFGVPKMWGDNATFTPSSRSAGTLSGAPTKATATFYNSYNSANQITSGNSQTLTLSGFDGATITGLTLSVRSNTSSPYKGAATIAITINGSSKGSKSVSRPGASYGNQSVSVTSTKVNNSTNVVITVTASENSFYVQSYTIAYTPKAACTVSFNTGTGNPSVASRTEASGGAGITLPTTSDLVPACSSDGWYLYAWATAAYGSSSTTTAPSSTFVGYPGMKYYPESTVTLYAVYAKATGAATAQTLTGTYASHSGWTISDDMCTNGYWILCTGQSITSPLMADLSSITSIVISTRTYGGASYKTTVVKTDGGTSVGSVNADGTSFGNKTISSPSISGSGSLVFTSSTTTAANGPGVNSITINYTSAPKIYWSNPTCAACSSNPSIGNASINSSLFCTALSVPLSF